MSSVVVGPVHAVHSVRIVLDPRAARARNNAGKRSLYPELLTSGIAHIKFKYGPAEDNIKVSFVDHGANRDVYFGHSVRLGDVALKIQPSTEYSNQNEKDLVDGGFKPCAVTVFWMGHASLGLSVMNADDDNK